MAGEQDQPQMGSPRGFGLVFAVVFAIIGLWPLTGDGGPRYWSLGVAAAFLIVAYTIPSILQPLNRIWYRFGLLLGRIMTPVIMTIIFLGMFTPTGLLLRLFGKDPMARRFDPKANSYWIKRTTPVGSMRNQF